MVGACCRITSNPEIVHFIDILRRPGFRNDDLLNVALGLDIDGKGVYASIAKMPHGLVAGATGSGKSVCINTILMSLLFQYTPDELKLKQVNELLETHLIRRKVDPRVITVKNSESAAAV